MEIDLVCIPCFFKQAINTLQRLKIEKEIQKQIVKEISQKISEIDFSLSPPVFSREIYEIISKKTNNQDPFKEIKKYTNELALNIWDFLEEIYEKSQNKIETAIKIAIAGNIIDFGALPEININSKEILKNEVQKALSMPISLDAFKNFENDLKKSKNILYIGDNSGEIVFDKILIKHLKSLEKEIFFAVRGKPIINDITLEDAMQAGIQKYAKIVNSGSPIPGCDLSYCSQDFKNLFHKADIVIAKGQGNFETLEKEKRTMYFLLRVKCKPVAKYLNKNIGDIVFVRYH
ncbi:hypothetical protein DRN73_09370 [Candidatus Pacearchaeota archaeon]|nr:MAG: hypothetical protein DRN73_09370 [Candidatus Pacearchaeota archaeon]